MMTMKRRYDGDDDVKVRVAAWWLRVKCSDGSNQASTLESFYQDHDYHYHGDETFLLESI